MRVGPLPLSPSHRSQSTVAIVVAFVLVVFRLPRPLPSLRGRLSCHLGRRGLDIIATRQTGIRKGKMGSRGNWTRETETASPASYAREDATEFTLDARFSGGSLQLWLCSLNGLRQRRETSFAVQLPYPQEPTALLASQRWSMATIVYMAWWAGRLEYVCTRAPVISDRGGGRPFLTRPRALLLLLRLKMRG